MLPLADAVDHDFRDKGVNTGLCAQLLQSRGVHGLKPLLPLVLGHLRKGLVHAVRLLPVLEEVLDPFLLGHDALDANGSALLAQLRHRLALQLLLLPHDDRPQLGFVLPCARPGLGLEGNDRLDHVSFVASLKALARDELLDLANRHRLQLLCPPGLLRILRLLQLLLLAHLLRGLLCRLVLLLSLANFRLNCLNRLLLLLHILMLPLGVSQLGTAPGGHGHSLALHGHHGCHRGWG
mmetsp:Transcript_50621/g.159375  ORF Transcript_50621/g.159375 Transcript_50621/m.159375 type:complete len:237 (-) Transcript_50621:44-754(-)